MYKIYMDGLLIHNDKYEKVKLDNPVIEEELNNPGKLDFTVYPDHVRFVNFSNGMFKKLKSIVKVFQDEILIFKGRMLENNEGLYTERQILCEGELAFLLDSCIRPYSKTGTPEELLNYYIGIHNEQMKDEPEKQFYVGRVTVTDGEENTENQETRSNSEITTTWAEINDKLLNTLGGYLILEHSTDIDENGNEVIKSTINWVNEEDFFLGNQTIEYGKNLLDLKVKNSGGEIATAIIPRGAKLTTAGEETETRLDITSKEDGIVAETEDDVIYKKDDYIYSESGVEEYGLIFAPQNWDDITEDVDHLLKVGIEELNRRKKAIESIEIKTIDLYKIENVGSFRIGTKVKVTSKKHGLKGENFPITTKTTNLTNPAGNTLTLTKAERSFTDNSIASSGAISTIDKNVTGLQNQTNTAITGLTEEVKSAIKQTSEEILTTVSESYTSKEDHNALIEEVNTEFQQTSEAFEMRFTEIHANLEEVANNANDHYQEQVKYIRFKDGNIILGEEGNEITLKISNDRISFIQDGLEVAYFNNRKLYVTEGEYLQTLKLGKFAFIPRESGNLSFKKVE